MQFFILILFFLFSSLSASEILVSVAPQKYLVERISNRQFSVDVIVPSGASPHSYEPTPKQMVEISKGKIWFRLGEDFEKRLLECLKNATIVDTREGLDLLYSSCCHHDESGHDPHIWLSPKLLKIQAKQITEELCIYAPQHATLFRENLASLHCELDQLDREISAILSEKKNGLILVSHPAFGYFCRDYGLRQLSIEMEGKEPSPKYITNILNQSRKENVRTVYLQKQYSSRGGNCIARELGARTQFLDPYAENVIANLREIAMAFKECSG